MPPPCKEKFTGEKKAPQRRRRLSIRGEEGRKGIPAWGIGAITEKGVLVGGREGEGEQGKIASEAGHSGSFTQKKKTNHKNGEEYK